MTLPPWLRLLLWPASILYGDLARLRARLYAQGTLKTKRLSTPVISVGNLTVGGTGKTPMVIFLAERFLAQGQRVCILTRGYKGAAGTSDEIELMKFRLQDRVMFGVGPDRYETGRQLESKGVDIFLLDDGFQHLPLFRDVNILLMDASQPLARESLAKNSSRVTTVDPLPDHVLRRAYLVPDDSESVSAKQLAKFQSQKEPE